MARSILCVLGVTLASLLFAGGIGGLAAHVLAIEKAKVKLEEEKAEAARTACEPITVTHYSPLQYVQCLRPKA